MVSAFGRRRAFFIPVSPPAAVALTIPRRSMRSLSIAWCRSTSTRPPPRPASGRYPTSRAYALLLRSSGRGLRSGLRRRYLAYFLLQCPHVGIGAAGDVQFVVGAALDGAAGVHHLDLLGVDVGCEAMRDHQG